MNGSAVYAGGDFGNIGGQPRNYLAGLDVASGLATAWNPDPGFLVNTLATHGTTIFAGGMFSTIGGQPRGYVAAIDAADPTPLAAVVGYPNGGESLPIGGHRTLTWSASGGHGVQSVDLYLSRSGAGGPWELIAAGVANTGAYEWVVTGPVVANNAYLRVDAREWTGTIASDLSDGAFSIETPTAVPPRGPLDSFALQPVAPNPAGGKAQVSFVVPSRARVRIDLFDAAGRQVAVLADGEFEPGRHLRAIDTKSLGVGLYFLRMRTPGADLKQRMAVVR